MNPSRRSLLALALTAVAGASQAQPATLKIIVPFPAGGVTDQAARIIGEKMGQQLGLPAIIDNRPGAGGRIGIDAVAKAPADGNTLLFTNSSYSILPVIDARLPYDITKVLAPVGISATYSLQMVTRSNLPVNSLPEFVAYAKKNPGKLSYGSAGVGSGANFAGEFFKSLTGTYLVHIPYKSTSAALNDVAGGLLDLAFDGAAKPLIDAGRVKLLATTGEKRDPRFASTPTAVEAGLKGFVQQSWAGLLAPAATPPAAMDKLSKAALAAASDPAVQKRLAELGLAAQGGTPAAMGAAIRDELVLYRGIATKAKLQFD
ncbi:tripartite tricarboxylate transporter substrate binding protein [Ramlibacter sp. XY19]|uniref:tripartite tricarboxylate transporter substrate-binding protein n=1 Tax=Ramlibacter paludis TaxID=2908000 RepID=UPI0023DC9568|nr:tripartite tricarboxylate transporter substrate-binding protein [Ramlibacter paludis]MCG2592406.1 tripartite tricarboxylate transporter substrate binding protein [Ramlibacter paludis]